MPRETKTGRDRVGDPVGLLGSESAMFDRTGGGVPRGVNVGHPLDPSDRIGGDKPPPVYRYTRDPRTPELWHGDNAVRPDQQPPT